ncbi:MAG: hypothetical protein U1E49_20355 [Hyphomicrobiaceae bacterium]
MKLDFPPSTLDPTWYAIEWAAWIISAILIVWMIYDWIKTDSTTSEAMLTSSREGEIEAVSEKHEVR